MDRLDKMSDEELRQQSPARLLINLNRCEQWATESERYRSSGDSSRAEMCASVYTESTGVLVDGREELRNRLLAILKDKPQVARVFQS